jgi:hypothetical protein
LRSLGSRSSREVMAWRGLWQRCSLYINKRVFGRSLDVDIGNLNNSFHYSHPPCRFFSSLDAVCIFWCQGLDLGGFSGNMVKSLSAWEHMVSKVCFFRLPQNYLYRYLCICLNKQTYIYNMFDKGCPKFLHCFT